MAKGGNSISKTAVWILMGLLILGLGGFGATNLTGTVNTLGTVGDKTIDLNTYARDLGREIQNIQRRSGEPLPFTRVREIGLDQAVLSRLVTQRALDNETSNIGLSIGDENLRDQILQIPTFQGVDGSFDREGYTFALRNSGLSESEFETTLREETARTILQGAVSSGVVMPQSYADSIVSYVAEQRDFTWARLTANDLDGPLLTATSDDLRSYYDENTQDFMRPDIKRLTFVHLSPDSLLPTIEIPEDQLRAEYETRIDEYNTPERRLVERLVFLDQEAADQAAAALEVNGTTFEALVDGRGLELADIDLGDVQRLELGDAGEAVFTAEAGDVVGPFATDLGPALFRVNGVLPAQSTSFEDAQLELRDALGSDRARRIIASEAENLDDLLAGGTTLEEIAAESDMELGTLDWFDGSGDGIAAYVDFAEAARAVTVDDFPAIESLDDGGVFAIRLEEEIPAQPAPFDEVRPQVQANWENAQTENRLREQAEALVPQLAAGTDFAGLGLDATQEVDQTRSSFVGGTPPSFMSEVFEMATGDLRVIDSFGTVLLVRLDAVSAASDDPETQELQAQLTAQINQSLAQDVFDVFAQDTLLRAGQHIDQRALQAVHVNFP
ncbi:peptidyl-prolyl cis-trans isomerase [Ascidiaceihabitans sp.]|uniref:peptidyl-prolyl cis-trans isomerase n=1 Tax=Ascidiaceihabitans sp. TaxID=1872644 RepID=UPI00329A7560